LILLNKIVHKTSVFILTSVSLSEVEGRSSTKFILSLTKCSDGQEFRLTYTYKETRHYIV